MDARLQYLHFRGAPRRARPAVVPRPRVRPRVGVGGCEAARRRADRCLDPSVPLEDRERPEHAARLGYRRSVRRAGAAERPAARARAGRCRDLHVPRGIRRVRDRRRARARPGHRVRPLGHPRARARPVRYLTFFPVTIAGLRGLRSPDPRALELMRSYAASPRDVLVKVRMPAAAPYLFAALKVAATASVVGAIIGELPSGIRDGLGGAILNFNQYYISGPPKLWAAIIVAAVVGIGFFAIVRVAEAIFLAGRLGRVET
ncbi:MAG: ABC transporter permease subunit [Chloroflexi bacterium]|nr:MAG: ABC transporter permease subunit [Chloroflexota bacterium]